MTIRHFKVFLIFALTAAAFAASASAQAGTGSLEVFGGITFIGGDVVLPCPDVCIPEPGEANIPDVKSDFDDDTPTFGIAGGYRVSDKFGILGSLSWIDGDDTIGAPFEGSNLELDAFFIDFSFMFFPGGNRFYIFAGPGLADVEVNGTVQSVSIPEQPSVTVDLHADDQTASVHAGIGVELDFGEKGLFRWQVKARSVDSDAYDDLDVETTLGIGIRFGG